MQGYAITVYAHDVEANSGAGGDDLGVVGGEGPELRALARIDRAQRAPAGAAVSSLDLDEDQGPGLHA